MTKPHEYYMSQALELAREAADAGEVPPAFPPGGSAL